MFEPEWMEYFEREAPFSYYCVLFLGFLGKILFYCSYVILLILLMTPAFLIYSSTKEIKIKFVDSKKHKKLKKEQKKEHDAHQNLYMERLSKNLNKKKKH
jgi:hypothetical protein